MIHLSYFFGSSSFLIVKVYLFFISLEVVVRELADTYTAIYSQQISVKNSLFGVFSGLYGLYGLYGRVSFTK